MKQILLIISFLILIPYTTVQGQETDSLSEHASFYSFLDFRVGLAVQAGINFENQINNHSKTALLFNYGIGVTGIANPPFLNSPITLTALFGSKPYNKRAKHFEINAGLLALIDPIDLPAWTVSPRISFGYRYQDPQSGKIFRFYAGFLSIGISFNL